MAASEHHIKSQLEVKKIKRDVDVKELYLAKRDLTDVVDLSRFKNLRYLWLNENKLHRIDCLANSFRLCELYLNDNELVDITGSLRHLTSLQVLHLNNNQLEKLERVVSEIKSMQTLTTLNLFSNPISQEQGYRHYVIAHVPSVELLDRSEVLKSERDASRKHYDGNREAIKDTIAFGRRSEGPPALYYPPDNTWLQPTKPASFEVGNNFYRNHPPYGHVEEAVEARHMRRSIMAYSSFDWSKVPRGEQRRVSEKPFENPQIITTRFR